MSGPLTGVRVLEFAGLGPGPFAAMMLADMGADIIRLDRADLVEEADEAKARTHLLNRGRRSVGIDLKAPGAAALVLDLCRKTDVVLEGFRPGVMERLGVGPEPCMAVNPQLVYGRMTGWGQDGPYAAAVGHDINYIALAGPLEAIGRAGEPPVPPLNLVGDYGGGGMLLAFGVVSALLEAGRSGRGQVIDAAMIDGAALQMTSVRGLQLRGEWSASRGTNYLDSGAHFYDVYETSDGKFVSIGAIEPHFYARLLDVCGMDSADLPDQGDRSTWPEMKKRFAAMFRLRTRDEWVAQLESADVCFAPVLSLEEAMEHPHHRQRQTFRESQGVAQPAPAPRFSRTPGGLSLPPPAPGEHTTAALIDWGMDLARVQELQTSGALS